MLKEHKVRSPHSQPDAFVFATRTGRALGQRNVLRALRRLQRAALTPDGKPTFPALHESGPTQRGAAPDFHGFRHTAASQAISGGDSVEEVSWQLGHRNSNVTRAVYVQEVKNADRIAKRRAKMEARYGDMLIRSAEDLGPENTEGGEVVQIASHRETS